MALPNLKENAMGYEVASSRGGAHGLQKYDRKTVRKEEITLLPILPLVREMILKCLVLYFALTLQGGVGRLTHLRCYYRT